MRSNRIRTTALAATALLAALSLTACSDNGIGDNGKAGAAAPAESATDRQSPAASAPDTGKDAGSASGAPAENAASEPQGSTGATSGRKSNTGTTGNSSSPVTCIGQNTKVTVSKVSRPINHLLLTMTNTGSRPCYAYHAPKLRFDDAQSVFRILDDSRPQAVVTLAPGESAYAGIGLTGDPEMKNLHKSTHLGVYFSAKDASGDTGTAPDELTLPANTSWDDQGFVTYWQSDMADALTY